MNELIIARGAAIAALHQQLDGLDDAVLIINSEQLERLGAAGTEIIRSEVERRKLVAEYDPRQDEWRITRPSERVLA